MRLLWRAQLDLPGATFSAFKPILAGWLRSPRREPTFGSDLEPGDYALDRGGSVLVDEVRESGEIGSWALRYERPLAEQGLVWVTEVGLRRAASASGLRGNASLYQTLLPGGAARFDRVSLRPPSFIWTLRERGFFSAGRFKAQDVGYGDTERFVRDVIDPARSVPLLAVSVENFSERTLLDPEALQDLLVGVAQVVIVSKPASLGLPREFERAGAAPGAGKVWGVYGGAVRVYRPTAELGGSAFDHPLHLPKDVQAPGFVDELKDWCWSFSTLQAPIMGLDVATIRAERRHAAFAARAEAEADEWTDFCQTEVGRAKEEATREKQRAEELLEKNGQLEAKVEALKYQLQRKAEASIDSVTDRDFTQESESDLPLAYYASNNGRRPALDFVDELDQDSRATALRALSDLPEVLRTPGHKAIAKVKGGDGARARLWEFRVNTKDLWLRFFFARATEGAREVLVLSGYKKKQNELDEGEIDRAAGLLRAAWDNGWE